MVRTRTDIDPEELERLRIEEEKRRMREEAKKQKLNSQDKFKNFQVDPEIFTKKEEKIKEDIPKVEIKQPEFIRDEKGNVTGLVKPEGDAYLGLKESDVNSILGKYNQTPEQVKSQGIQQVGAAQAQFEQQIQAEKLAGQIGQFEQLGVQPSGLDFKEAATTGLISAIPKALSYAIGGAIAGGVGGAAIGGVGAIPAAIIGAATGFVSGISSKMISNLKSQRTDTVNAQKRVLDEGKQNLNDWATLAANDPVNRAIYISRFNQQLSLIDQAYRTMKYDTNRDLAKFETAIPDLAEFEAFYMSQGERDYLVSRMRQSLGVQQDPEYIYQLAELNNRLGND